jgi:hypothetical protein
LTLEHGCILPKPALSGQNKGTQELATFPILTLNSIATNSERSLGLNVLMNSRQLAVPWLFLAIVVFSSQIKAEQMPAERVTEIQSALREAKMDGWLFYDFRHSDPLAFRILKLDEHAAGSRRWFSLVLVHHQSGRSETLGRFEMARVAGWQKRKPCDRSDEQGKRSCSRTNDEFMAGESLVRQEDCRPHSLSRRADNPRQRRNLWSA